MSAFPLASPTATPIESIGTPQLWAMTIAGAILLVIFDFIITRKPHDVSMKEAVGWTIFYIALPIIFGVWVWNEYGNEVGVNFYTGWLVEKSLSVDNLFVFIVIIGSFAVPRQLQQRVLLVGVVGALVLRGIFIAVGATLIEQFAITFLVFGGILLATAIKVFRDARSEEDAHVDVDKLAVVRFIRRFWPVTANYHGTKIFWKEAGRRALTPLGLVMATIIGTDVVFAIDSIPAVYGITSDPYLVFATNAFALLGLRALYFVLEGALSKLVYLGYGLSVILGFIGVKLVLHWAHGIWSWVPEISSLFSLAFIIVVLAVTTIVSLRAKPLPVDQTEGNGQIP
jgi:TerC family integral membrane protein